MDMPVSVIAEVVARRGTILLSRELFPDIDHGKFFIIIGENKEHYMGFFFINSGVNKFLTNKPKQLALQYPLRHADYAFLHHDSFAGCHEIHTLNKSKVNESIKNKKTKIIEELRKEHLEDILKMVRSSNVFSAVEKEAFFA